MLELLVLSLSGIGRLKLGVLACHPNLLETKLVIYVRMYVCMYVYVYVCVCICVCIYVCKYSQSFLV